MKSQLEILSIALLKVWSWILIGVFAVETVIITLDLLGYENQAKTIANYFRL